MNEQVPENQILIPKKKFFTKKKIIWTSIIIVIVAFIAWRIHASKTNTSGIQTASVTKQDIKQTVLATGQVVSSTDLNLSFQTGGVVSKVNVQEGDTVKAGQVLAQLQANNQAAALTSAQGSLAQAQANYNKVLAGSSSEQVAVAQVNLTNAQNSLKTTQAQQQVLVNNAYSALLNSGLAAIPSSSNTGNITVTVSGAYTGTDQGVYQISLYSTGGGVYYQVSGLETGQGVAGVTPQPVGTKGLYIQFSSSSIPSSNSWTISIPNTQSATYVANYNAYQSALQTQAAAVAAAQNAVATAQANLNLQTAQPQTADVQAAQAAILSAQGQVQAAQAALANTVILAPSDGTITSVDTKVGEQASALQEAIILQDVSSLHVEADVSEADIASLQPAQSVDITFDALGPDRHFTGSVLSVDPGATVVSGVVDYLVKASIPNISDIKPGMTANMTILVAQKSGVLAVPSSAIISQNGNQYVRVITNDKTKTYNQVQVQTGLQADGGLVEITSGLTAGQEIVTYINP
jgi:HlyD family secretion protein